VSDEKSTLIGEESSDAPTSALRNLLAALVVAAIAVLAIVLAVKLPNPGELASHPGLLPLLTGVSLLGMAVLLGAQAVRAGALRELRNGSGWDQEADGAEPGRILLLIGIIFIYVLLVDFFGFDFRYPTPLFTLRFSSFEAWSIPMLALILWIFWRATLLRCLLVAAPVTIVLASIFRSGFNILLPGSG
jgi:hypothetical protein